LPCGGYDDSNGLLLESSAGVISGEAVIPYHLSLDAWISYIVPPGGGSQVFGRGGEQPPSMTAALRKQMTITGRMIRLLAI
jgi:hypothetical protein